MSWSYNPAQLATNTTYQVRRLIGDVNMNTQQVQDEEIAFALTQRATIYGAAAECCSYISAQYSRDVDTVAGELRTLYSSRAKAYAARGAYFESVALTRSGALPYAGGISESDKATQEQDADRVPPSFNIGMEEADLPVGPVGNETSSGPEPEAGP